MVPERRSGNGGRRHEIARGGVYIYIYIYIYISAFEPLCLRRAGTCGGRGRGGGDGRDSLSRADSLFHEGHSEAAYRAYLDIVKDNPENYTALLSLARAAVRSGHPHQAIWAYDVLLTKYPNEKILYGEIGQAYIAIGDRRSAESWLRRDTTMSDADRASALDRMTGAADRFRIYKQLRFGFLYDSNANQGPGSGLLIDKWIITSDSLGAISTAGLYLGGGVNMSYQIKEGEPYYYVGDLAFSARRGFSDSLRKSGQEYSQWYRAAIGLRRLTGNNVVDFRIKGEIYDYDFYNTIYSYGAELAFVHKVSRSFSLMTRAGADHREYVRQDARVGTYGYIGEYGKWAFGGGNEFNLGVRYIFGNADYGNYSYNAWEGSLGFRFKMERFELLPTVRYVRENYDGPATVIETKDRSDNRWIIGLALVYPINKELNFEASYSYTDNDSESPFYKYDRHMINLGWVWNF